MYRVTGVLLRVATIAASASLYAQVDLDPIAPSKIPNELLDPARDLQRAPLESALHRPLPEQYIWTGDGREAAEPHYNAAPDDQSSQKPVLQFFRRVFDVSSVPPHATLYVAVPGHATIYLNGKAIGHYQLNLGSELGLRVYELDVTSRLHTGKNVLAIEALA